MPFIKVYIHFVWSTKNRIPFLNTRKLRTKVWIHIKQNAKEKGIFIDFVNGYSDHCHCLVSLKHNQSIQEIMHLIKGESSFWINENNLLKNNSKGFQIPILNGKMITLLFLFLNQTLAELEIILEIRKSIMLKNHFKMNMMN